MSTSEKNRIDSKRFTLKKAERLSSKKTIEKLFASGQSFLQYPIKFVYLPTTLSNTCPVQAGFSVSKKNFKKAVDRNRIKRLLRETYRLNKFKLYDILEQEQMAMFMIYIGKEMPDYALIENATQKGLQRLAKELKKEQ